MPKSKPSEEQWCAEDCPGCKPAEQPPEVPAPDEASCDSELEAIRAADDAIRTPSGSLAEYGYGVVYEHRRTLLRMVDELTKQRDDLQIELCKEASLRTTERDELRMR